MARADRKPAPQTAGRPVNGVRYVRFLMRVEGPGVIGGRVDAGDVARDPYPEVLQAVPHETITEAEYRLNVRLGRLNPMVERVG